MWSLVPSSPLDDVSRAAPPRLSDHSSAVETETNVFRLTSGHWACVPSHPLGVRAPREPRTSSPGKSKNVSLPHPPSHFLLSTFPDPTPCPLIPTDSTVVSTTCGRGNATSLPGKEVIDDSTRGRDRGATPDLSVPTRWSESTVPSTNYFCVFLLPTRVKVSRSIESIGSEKVGEKNFAKGTDPSLCPNT